MYLRVFGRLVLAASLLIPSVAAAEPHDAVYAVTVSLNWSEETSAAPPPGAHWSTLIAFAHSDRYALFSDGDTASSGLALVATNGRTTVLEAELAEGMRRKRVGAHIILPGSEGGQATFAFELPVTPRQNRISFATMLAPSPDWFSGISGVLLYEADAWVDQVERPIWVWDAGADSGPDFEGPNLPTQPRQSVRLLSHPSFLRASGLRPIGTVVFERR